MATSRLEASKTNEKNTQTKQVKLASFNVPYNLGEAALNTGTEYTVGKLPANVVITRAYANVTTAFDDAGDTTLTLDTGTTGDPNGFNTADDAETEAIYAADGALLGTLTADEVDVSITVQTDSTASALTAGELDLMIEYFDFERSDGEQLPSF